MTADDTESTESTMTHTSHHPTLDIAFHWRSKRRVLNIAVALRGKSSGWGMPGRHWWSGNDKPRRWFVGHHRAQMLGRRRGFDVVLTKSTNGMREQRWTLINAMRQAAR